MRTARRGTAGNVRDSSACPDLDVEMNGLAGDRYRFDAPARHMKMGQRAMRHALLDDVGGRSSHGVVAIEGAENVDRRPAVAHENYELARVVLGEFIQQ